MAMSEEEKNKQAVYQFLIAQKSKDRAADMGGLANLIRASESHPEAGQAALARYGINVPAGMNRRDAALRNALQIEAFRSAARGRGAIPSNLVGSIGTPDFGRRLQDALSTGALDRQGVQTLYDLDRKEREFQTRSNKPGKPSPVYEKLRQIAAQGIPLTEDIVMGITSPAVAKLPAYKEALAKRQAEGGEQRTFSLGQFAGLDSGTEEAAPSPETGMQASQDERRQRLRGLLTGGGY